MTLKIAVFKEKHCNRYYSFETNEEFEALALGILRERYNEGWYESLEYFQQFKINSIKHITKSYPEFDLYPQPLTEPQKAQKREMENKIERFEEEYSTDIEFMETLERLLSLPAGETLKADRFDEFRSASDLLRHRGDYEYESFEVIVPKKFGES